MGEPMQELDKILEWKTKPFKLADNLPLAFVIKSSGTVAFYEKDGVKARFNAHNMEG